jgi:outer membrane protein OmpA-like peptidoglycan-associated protein
MKHAIVYDPPTFGGARAILGAVLKLAGLALILTALLAFPAFSQQLAPQTWEFNTFGRYTDFGRAMNLESGVGGGLRLGYFVHPRWELEGGLGITRVDRITGTGTENVVPALFDVTYNYPIGWYQLLLGGGAVYNNYGSSDAWGTSLSAGVRLAFGQTAALRVDGTREYINRGDNIARHSNWGLRLGLSWMLPKRTPTIENISVKRVDLATLDLVRMPLLRESDPVAIMRLETERARRDSTAEAGTTIHFDVGSSKVRSDASVTLGQTLQFLRTLPTLRIRIEGQADIPGSTPDDISLAWDRAGAAKVWLTNHGMDPDRIDAVGYTEGRPRCGDSTDACSSRIRRNEFLIVAGAEAVVPASP